MVSGGKILGIANSTMVIAYNHKGRKQFQVKVSESEYVIFSLLKLHTHWILSNDPRLQQPCFRLTSLVLLIINRLFL